MADSFALRFRNRAVRRGRAVQRGRPLHALFHLDQAQPEDDAEDGTDAEQPEPEPRHVDLRVEAFDDGDEGEDASPRARWVQENVLVPRNGQLRLPISIPPGLDGVRYVGKAGDAGDAEPPTVGEETVAVQTGERDRVIGTTRPIPPSIFDVLELRAANRPAPQEVGLDAVIDHVCHRLTDDLNEVFDDAAYRIPDETDGAGTAVSSLEDWQKDVILYLSGSFYSYAPRRNLRVMETGGVGYFNVAVCNHLVDTITWMRGVPFPGHSMDGDSAGNSVGFSCHDTTMGLLNDAKALYGENSEAFVDNFDTGASRTESFARARPGSILVWPGHVAVVLRVREREGTKELQLFDTGGVSGTLGPIAEGVGTRSKCLQESGWYTRFGRISYGDIRGHAYLPPRPDSGRRFHPRPLWTPLNGRESYRCIDPDGTTRPASNPPRPEGVTTREQRVRHDARPAQARLAVFEGDDLRYLSPVLELRLPLVQLFHSVLMPPDASRYQARWLALVKGDWARAASYADLEASSNCVRKRGAARMRADCADTHSNHAGGRCTHIPPEHLPGRDVQGSARREAMRAAQEHRCTCTLDATENVVVEIYNTSAGRGRLYRANMKPRTSGLSGFGSRLRAVVDASDPPGNETYDQRLRDKLRTGHAPRPPRSAASSGSDEPRRPTPDTPGAAPDAG